MNQKLLIAIIIIIAAAGLWWWQAKAPAASTAGDSSATISQELGTVDVGDVGKEFQQIDADLKGL